MQISKCKCGHPDDHPFGRPVILLMIKDILCYDMCWDGKK